MPTIQPPPPHPPPSTIRDSRANSCFPNSCNGETSFTTVIPKYRLKDVNFKQRPVCCDSLELDDCITGMGYGGCKVGRATPGVRTSR